MAFLLETCGQKDYFAYKKQLIPQIMEAYKHLDEEYDVIVIEGAGRSGRDQLKSDDIVTWDWLHGRCTGAGLPGY